MKKLLGFLATITLVTTTSTSVIACGEDPGESIIDDNSIEPVDISSLNSDLELEYRDVIKNTAVITAFVNKNKEKLNGAKFSNFDAVKVESSTEEEWKIIANQSSKLVIGEVIVKVNLLPDTRKSISTLSDDLEIRGPVNDETVVSTFISKNENKLNDAQYEDFIATKDESSEEEWTISGVETSTKVKDSVTVKAIDVRIDISQLNSDLTFTSTTGLTDKDVIQIFYDKNKSSLGTAQTNSFTAVKIDGVDNVENWKISAKPTSKPVRGKVVVKITIVSNQTVDISTLNSALEIKWGTKITEKEVIKAFLTKNKSELSVAGATNSDFTAAKVSSDTIEEWKISASSSAKWIVGEVTVEVSTPDNRIVISDMNSPLVLPFGSEINEKNVIKAFHTLNKPNLGTAQTNSFTAKKVDETSDGENWEISAKPQSKPVKGQVTVSVTIELES